MAARNTQQQGETKRRLAAVLYADVHGYTKLMSDNPEKTLNALGVCRHIFESKSKKFNGRIVDTAGDSVLAEFGSTLDAVQGGIEIQNELQAGNKSVNGAPQLRFRIGINSGEILVKANSIYGDVVNIAARIQATANAGGICVSHNVYEDIRNTLGARFEDSGYYKVKNVDLPVRIYRLHTDTVETKSTPTALTAVDKPSIAVLPFLDMNGSQEYFSDGITEDIITDLSKIHGLFVIARNSSFIFKGKSVDIREVATKLGVRYVLEGSVRRAGDRVRITAQLIDGTDGGHLWAERYDRDIHDVFAVQDEVTQSIVNLLKVKLLGNHNEPASINAIQKNINPVAYDLCLQGWATYMQFTPEAMFEARSLFERAIEADPKFSDSYARLARLYSSLWSQGIINDRAISLDVGLRLAEQAVDLGPTSGIAHAAHSFVSAWSGHNHDAVTSARRALEFDPGGAETLFSYAFAMHCGNRLTDADLAIRQAFALNPKSPPYYFWLHGQNLLFMRDLDKAIEILRRGIAEAPNFSASYVALSACLYLHGRREEAKVIADRILSLRPKFPVTRKLIADAWAGSDNYDYYNNALEAVGL